MKNKNILISGAGIAGVSIAYWLKKYGFNPTIIEQAPKLREGGYAIDFFGAGFDVAEKMGILSELELKDLKIGEIEFVDSKNKRKGALNAFLFRKLMNNKFYNILRSDLSQIMFNKIKETTEVIFGDTITKIEQNSNEVNVSFKKGKSRNFDLVIGADGLHSNVRGLLFGNESQFEFFLGFYVSAFTIDKYKEIKNSFITYTEPGKQVNIYPLEGNKMTVMFIFTTKAKFSYNHYDIDKQKQILREQYQHVGWECPRLLKELDTTSDFYFDSVSQIKMNNWSKGRISLIGDACDCPSLLSGQGSTLAMVAAYILAGELKNHKGDYTQAFQQYETIFKPFIDNKQKIAQKFASSFIPKSKIGIWTRNTFSNVLFSSFMAKWLVKLYMSDKIHLKEY